MKEENQKQTIPIRMFVCENPDCKKEHDGSYGSGRFCCKKCKDHTAALNSAKTAKKNGTRKCNFNKKRAPYGTWKCRVCGLIFGTKHKLWEHMHDQHPENIKQRGAKGVVPWNKGLTKETDDRIAQASEKIHNGYKSGRLIPSFSGKHHSNKTKKLMSKKRIKYLSDNPDKHPWKKSIKFKSVPCENVKSQLHAFGLEFVEEYKPLHDRNFAIDIAFPKQKIGFEINGNQHYSDYKNGILSAYYQERHNLIEKAGWTLVEIHYANVFHKDFIKNLLSTIGLL